jgi:hypothetical protein
MLRRNSTHKDDGLGVLAGAIGLFAVGDLETHCRRLPLEGGIERWKGKETVGEAVRISRSRTTTREK